MACKEAENYQHCMLRARLFARDAGSPTSVYDECTIAWQHGLGLVADEAMRGSTLEVVELANKAYQERGMPVRILQEDVDRIFYSFVSSASSIALKEHRPKIHRGGQNCC